MTPEPDIGIYCKSIYEFLNGYTEKVEQTAEFWRPCIIDWPSSPASWPLSQPDKLDSDGVLSTWIDDQLHTAAAWSFKKLLNVWKRKHEKAVYVQVNRPGVQFHYLKEVQICEGADFFRVLKCIAEGKLYLDPAVKALR